MKFKSFAFTALAMLTCSLALASSGPSASVGWYFDEAGTQSCYSGGQYDPVTAYLCLKGASSFLCSAWELQTSVIGNCAVVSWNLAGAGLNVLTPPAFAVGIVGAGLAPNLHGVIVLATASVVPLDGEAISLGVHPIATPSISGFMAYTSSGDNVIRAVTSDSGDYGVPTCWINCKRPTNGVVEPPTICDMVFSYA